MRRQMGGGHGQYAKPLQPGDVMIGRGADLVVESRHPNFRSGDRVQGEFGWREHAVLDGRGLRKLAQDLRPLSLSLGIVGQSGATALVGLVDVANIKPGETGIVSAAAGAVGGAVGQIARNNGAGSSASPGGPAQCQNAVADLVSMIASTTRRARLDRRWPRWRRKQSISISTTSAATSCPPFCPAQTTMGACASADKSPNTTAAKARACATPTSCSMNASSSRVFASVATSHGGTRRWTSCWIGTGPAGSNSTRCRVRLGGGTGGAHQHAVGWQYRQAGGAPDRSDRMSLLRRRRVGRRAKCKW